MDAIAYLKSEHAWIRKTLKTISNGFQNVDTRLKMFDKLAKFLLVHEDMEQNVWYPFLIKNYPTLKKHIERLEEQEKKAAIDLKKFNRFDPESATWWKHFDKLYTNINDHAGQEETVLFPRVRQLVSKRELLELGKNMRRFKRTTSKY